MKRIALSLSLAALALAVPASAAQKIPQVSQAATVSQNIGLNEVTIKYHRPGVKGRKIWGELVPFGKVWRTGANEATTITFTEDVLVEGQPLAAGTYALFTIPGANEWTVLFNRNAKQWGAYEYKEGEDVTRIKVKPVTTAASEEWMSFRFQDPSLDTAKIVLAWEKLELPFTIKNKVETNTKVLAGLREDIKAAKADDWKVRLGAAEYCADAKTNLDEANGWADAALKIKNTTWGHFEKARILREKGTTSEAVTHLEEALKAAGPEDDKAFLDEIKSQIVAWKK